MSLVAAGPKGLCPGTWTGRAGEPGGDAKPTEEDSGCCVSGIFSLQSPAWGQWH